MSEVELSIISPVYLSDGCLKELIDRIFKTVPTLCQSFELILVDDGSPDSSWSIIENHAKQKNNIVGVKLSKNFGQHQAIAAGIGIAKGSYVVVMDCDLQNPPEEITRLYNEAKTGKHDIVLSRRKNRVDGVVSQYGSYLYHGIMTLLTGKNIDPEIGTFCIFSRKVADEYVRLREKHRTLIDILFYLGFSPHVIDLPNPQRGAGKSSYTFKKKFLLAVNELINHTTRVIYFCVGFSFILVILSLLSLLCIFTQYMLGNIGVPGWASVISLVIFFGGFIGAMLGLIGLYIAKVYIEVRDRPLYVIQNRIN